VDARVGDGSVSTEKFEELKRAFTLGEFQTLLFSPVGKEGHSLQAASALCHIDLPWTPDRPGKRVGRAARPGARRSSVQSYLPYIRGAAIGHVVSVLAPRGGEHHQMLIGQL